MTIADQVRSLIVQHLGIDHDSVTDEGSSATTLGPIRWMRSRC